MYLVFYIYMILNLVNGKIYVGQSNNPRRWKTHLNTSRSGRKTYKSSYSVIHAAIGKYGVNNFEFRIIQYVDSSQVSDAEKYWISFYKTNIYRYGNEFGYNLTDGGEGWFGHKHTPETKEKLRIIRTGTIASLETKGKMSAAKSGKYLGGDNANSKLTLDQIIEIKKMIVNGVGNRVIAKLFGVHHSTISAIRREKNWGHITI